MPPKKELGFDPGKLQSMAEPLNVRVERLRGASRMPIDLPPKDGYAPGMGWDIDSVLRLENWIVTEWAGGGVYRFVVSDVNGAKMEWESVYDPKLYPEKIPPTLNNMSAPSAGVAGSSWLPQVTTYPTIPPSILATPTPVAPVVPSSLSPGPQPWAGGWAGVPAQWPTAIPQPVKSERSTMLSDQNRLLTEQVQQLERKRLEGEFEARLERERQASAQQLAAMREEIAKATEAGKKNESSEIQRMREERDRDERRREQEATAMQFKAMQEAQAQSQREFRELLMKMNEPKEDSKLKALEDALRQQREEMMREREKTEAASRERDLREEMRRNQEDLARRLEAATANKGPDPMIMFLQESSRAQLEASKEAARNNQMQSDRIMNMMMKPGDVAALIKDSNNGADDLVRKVVGTYSGMFDTYKDLTSNILNLSGGGGESATVSMVKEGASHIAHLADRYLGGERDKSVSESKAKEAQATAYANAQMAQMNQMAQAQMMQAQMAQQQAGLGNAAPPMPQHQEVPSFAELPQEAPQHVEPQAPTNGQHVAPEPATVPKVKTKKGDRTADLFGPAAGEIKKLRLGVQTFLESLANKTTGKNGEIPGINPTQAVELVGRGIALAQQHGLRVKAFDELLDQGLYADFFDELLPNAPQTYRDDCVKILVEMFEEMQADAEDDDENGPSVETPTVIDIDDGDDSDDAYVS